MFVSLALAMLNFDLVSYRNEVENVSEILLVGQSVDTVSLTPSLLLVC